jgi:hypothetical protein
VIATKRNLETLLTVAALILVLGCDLQQDRRDAENVALRIHSQIQHDDFLSIHREAGQSFKQVGNESRFVSMMEQLRKENGLLEKWSEMAYQTGIDSNAGRTHVLIFDLEFERGHAKERMTLTRAEDGKMVLWDLAFDPIPGSAPLVCWSQT